MKKRLLTALLSFAILLSCFPVTAIVMAEAPNNEAFLDGVDELKCAYVEITIYAKSKGYEITLSCDDFVDQFYSKKWNSVYDYQNYIIDNLPEYTEQIDESNKRPNKGKNGEPVLSQNIEDYYDRYVYCCGELGFDTISIDEFIYNYSDSSISYSDYVNQCIYEAAETSSLNEKTPMLRSSGGNTENSWFYNTGTSLPRKADYSTYDLLSLVKKGDILYETTGDLAWVAGHIAIVEGIFWSTTQNQFYIRVIEASGEGVTRGVFDENRLRFKSDIILRLKNASLIQKCDAVDFCIKQLGKPYCLSLGRSTSESEKNWYCSELVWAAYKNAAGVSIDGETSGTVFPKDVACAGVLTPMLKQKSKPSNRFKDIGYASWEFPAAKFMADNGIMDMYGLYFYPERYASRGTVVTVLYRQCGSPHTGKSSIFPDVIESSDDYLPCHWANTIGVANGDEKGRFIPGAAVTREQLVCFIFRYAQYKKRTDCPWITVSFSNTCLNRFTDKNNVSEYAQTAMKWAVTNKIINGMSTTKLSPQSLCTRAQVAQIIYNFMNTYHVV